MKNFKIFSTNGSSIISILILKCVFNSAEFNDSLKSRSFNEKDFKQSIVEGREPECRGGDHPFPIALQAGGGVSNFCPPTTRGNRVKKGYFKAPKPLWPKIFRKLGCLASQSKIRAPALGGRNPAVKIIPSILALPGGNLWEQLDGWWIESRDVVGGSSTLCRILFNPY